MNDNYAVVVNDVTMIFDLQKEKTDTLKETFIKAVLGKNKRKHQSGEFTALENVSFNVEKGEAFAIIGSNGSGKSTMLKIISGIYKPTRGNVAVQGVVAPLIELGAGFDPDLTGRENIYLNGAVLGMERKTMDRLLTEIVDFAELWEFIDVPVKNYSSGMYARLGFSVATIVRPDVLIVDEILAVGDAEFQKKCQKKMMDMINAGTTLILVSHNSEQVKELCSRAVWIDHGRVAAIGEAVEVCNAYQNGG